MTDGSENDKRGGDIMSGGGFGGFFGHGFGTLFLLLIIIIIFFSAGATY